MLEMLSHLKSKKFSRKKLSGDCFQIPLIMGQSVDQVRGGIEKRDIKLDNLEETNDLQSGKPTTRSIVRKRFTLL